MHQHRLRSLVMMPSLSSATACIFASVIVLGVANWTRVLTQLPIYGYLFGSDGLVTNLHSAQDGNVFGQALSSTNTAHTVKIVVGVLLALLALYIAIRLIIKMVSSISFTLKELHAAETPAKYVVEHEMRRRAGIRLLVLVIWLAFIFVSIKVVLPFCILASQLGFNNNVHIVQGVSYVAFGLVLLAVTLHVHVIMARMLLLKPRVFGGEDILES